MHRFLAALVLAASALSPLPAIAQALAPPAVTAASWTLVDATSGQTLASQQAGERRDPASITKLMTAYVVFGALRQKAIVPSQMVNVSERAWKAEGSRMFIEPRKAVSVDELVHGMIVQSGNDASIALAELVAGSEEAFVERMNREAKRLGMQDTQFANATGLADPQHWSTAADVAKLAQAVVRDYPEFYPLYSQKEFRYNNITQPNRNRLLWSDPYVDGMKTGHTEAAGYCLIASAHRKQPGLDGERRLVSVVIGANSESTRAIESQKLLNYGFQNFDAVRVYAKGQPAGTYQVWKGAVDTIAGGFDSDLVVTVPRGQAEKMKAEVERVQPLVAPIAQGQRIGTLRVKIEDRVLVERPLLALAAVEPAGWFGRTWDGLRMMLSK